MKVVKKAKPPVNNEQFKALGKTIISLAEKYKVDPEFIEKLKSIFNIE